MSHFPSLTLSFKEGPQASGLPWPLHALLPLSPLRPHRLRASRDSSWALTGVGVGWGETGEATGTTSGP